MDDEPVIYRNSSRPRAKAAPQSQMSGAIVFWFIVSSLLGIVAIGSFLGNMFSGSYSSTTSIAMVMAMVWFIYSVITMILVGGKSGRLFVAISHIVFSIIALIFCIICMVALGQINSYTGLFGKTVTSYLNTLYTFSACLYLIAFCFYMIYGLYFLTGDGAIRWFNDGQTKEYTPRGDGLEYRVPSKSQKAASVKIRCANCNAEITPGMKFCPKCGTELDWGA